MKKRKTKAFGLNCLEDEKEDKMRYKINIKRTEEGYAVWVPGLPGCWSQGETEEEAIENIKDAIKTYLETVEELSKQEESRYVEVAKGLL